jgi:hypothetical protein
MLKNYKIPEHFQWISPTALAAMGGAASVRVADFIRYGQLFSLDAMTPVYLMVVGFGMSIWLQVPSRRPKDDAGQERT